MQGPRPSTPRVEMRRVLLGARAGAADETGAADGTGAPVVVARLAVARAVVVDLGRSAAARAAAACPGKPAVAARAAVAWPGKAVAAVGLANPAAARVAQAVAMSLAAVALVVEAWPGVARVAAAWPRGAARVPGPTVQRKPAPAPGPIK
jgi:hypothetical protein